jgi:hypothetical protein
MAYFHSLRVSEAGGRLIQNRAFETRSVSFSVACKYYSCTYLESAQSWPKGVDLWLFFQGAEEAAEKLGLSDKTAENVPPGLKPALILLALCGG